MPPEPRRTRGKFTSGAIANLRADVGNSRLKIIQAATAVSYDLPREGAGLLDAVVPNHPNCFHWYRIFPCPEGDGYWRMDCLVSKAGWPDTLWVVDAAGREEPNED